MSDPGLSPEAARIVFAGSPDFAVPCLRELIESPCDLVAVLTQPDRPAGRGRKLFAGPVKRLALARGIEVLQPESLAGAEIRARLVALQPDLLVVVAYGLLLPQAVLDIPRAGGVNVHASLLPRWRGAAPIQAAILAGDATTGVSLMQMEAGLDTGPVFARCEIPIAPTDTAHGLHDRLATLGAELLIKLLPGILDGTATAIAQDHAAATYAGRISKADARIDWHDSAVAIDRQIRAFNAWPVAETALDGRRMRCWAATRVPVADPADEVEPGRVVAVDADGIVVQTGAGRLRLTEIQLAGRRRLPAAEFANGYPVAGKVLGQ